MEILTGLVQVLLRVIVDVLVYLSPVLALAPAVLFAGLIVVAFLYVLWERMCDVWDAIGWLLLPLIVWPIKIAFKVLFWLLDGLATLGAGLARSAFDGRGQEWAYAGARGGNNWHEDSQRESSRRSAGNSRTGAGTDTGSGSNEQKTRSGKTHAKDSSSTGGASTSRERKRERTSKSRRTRSNEHQKSERRQREQRSEHNERTHEQQAGHSNESKGKDPFQVLGVSPSASQTEIKAAYRGLLKKYHPDFAQGLSKDEQTRRTDKTKELTLAYETILRLKGWH